MAVQLAPQALDVAMGLFDVLHCGQQHTAGATSGIIDGLDLFGVEHVDHQPNHAAGRVELTGLLVGDVGELLDQVFVGVANEIGRDVLVPQRERGKVLDQILEQCVRQTILVRPLGVSEHAIKGVRVCFLDATHGVLQS